MLKKNGNLAEMNSCCFSHKSISEHNKRGSLARKAFDDERISDVGQHTVKYHTVLMTTKIISDGVQ